MTTETSHLPATEGTDSISERRAVARIDGGRTQVRQSAIGLLRGDHVTFGQGAVGAIMSSGDVALSQAGTRAAIAGGGMRIRQGGGGLFLAGGDAEIHQGGVGTMVALGDVRVTQGGAVVAVAGRVEAAEGTWVGVALTPRLDLAPGARVVAGPAQAAIAGAVAGAVVGTFLLIARRLRGG